MKNTSLKLLALPLLAGALCITACGKKAEDSESAAAEKKIELPKSPDESIQMIVREMAKGNGSVLWQAMPASYQKDLTSVVQFAGTKIDTEIYDKIFVTVSRIANVFDQQKEFVFNSGLTGEEANSEQMAQLRAAWPSIIGLANTLTSSSISSTSGLAAFDGETFFADTVSAILKDADAISQIQPDSDQPKLSELSEASVTYISGTDSEATLEMVVPGQDPETEEFLKVEDRWVPKDMAVQWTTQMTETRNKLEAIDATQVAQQKPQILSIFAMIDGVLAQIEAAETQEQFDQALQGAMMPMMGLMMMGQGLGGGAAPGMQGGAPSMPMPPMPVAPSAPSAP